MDHRYHQLVLFPAALVEEPEVLSGEIVKERADEPFELITQQQMSRLAALVMLIGFLIFLVGYWFGQSVQREVFDSVVPEELFSASYSQGGSHLGATQGYECARVATLEEAVTLGSRLKDDYEIVPRTSRSVAGGEVTWYQINSLRKGYSYDQ